MFIEAFKTPDNSFHWLDVVDPTGNELEVLAKQYGIPNSAIQDCMDAKHLPKYEEIPDHIFIMLRSLDEKADEYANTVLALTQKISIFVGEEYIITIHRRDHPYLMQIREKWIKTHLKIHQDCRPQLLDRIILGVIHSYNPALNQAENKLEEYEEVVFEEESTTLSIQDKFILKSRAYVFKRVLRLTLDLVPKLHIIQNYSPNLYQEIRETLEASYFETENILQHVNNLITLHLSMASQRTNEIVRVLTIFSVFFMPLMFITGIYGMNFKHIPELSFLYGYPLILSFMLLVTIILYIWFRRRNWF